ncbi:HNH endonuclease [Gilliamella sp. Pas-s25]|uniref:HNH endonuclease n=1 Tax=Gilliamella sp. Pas-s25 TaxID=2687310 RepID=UPI003FA6032D
MIVEGEINPGIFTPEQLNAINAGKPKIPGYTWHHHQHRGRMQLVPEDAHLQTGHIGGEALSKGK